MRIHTLVEETWLPLPREQVFRFFADAGNLDAITPPWLHFRIVSKTPIDMKPGALIEYRLRVHWVPIFWRTEITEWDPPARFVDRQLKGPYRQWIHTHTFEEKDGGTLIRDCVDYAVPGWVFEPLVHRFFVKPDIDKIFKHRTMRIREILLAGRASDGKPLAQAAIP